MSATALYTPTCSMRSTHFRLSATAYSIYLQLSSILEAVSPSESEVKPYRGDRDTLITDIPSIILM
jgi:hypothetical protein